MFAAEITSLIFRWIFLTGTAEAEASLKYGKLCRRRVSISLYTMEIGISTCKCNVNKTKGFPLCTLKLSLLIDTHSQAEIHPPHYTCRILTYGAQEIYGKSKFASNPCRLNSSVRYVFLCHFSIFLLILNSHAQNQWSVPIFARDVVTDSAEQ